MAAHLTSLGPQGGVAFGVRKNAAQNNIAVAGSPTIVTFQLEIFDVGSNFASNTFTAPVTGKYQLNTYIRLEYMDTASTYVELYVVTSNRNYYTIYSPKYSSDPQYWNRHHVCCADMDASDTAALYVYQAAGTAQMDLGSSTWFSGFLIA